MVKLFCLPYAGGSAMVYNRWKRSINGMIQLCPIELAGRGIRFSKPYYDSLPEAVDDIYGMIKNQLDSGPYAFYGHSMGSLLVYELVRKIMTLPHRQPVQLFMSGGNPPHIKNAKKIYHTMPEEQFRDEIIKIGGTPQEVFEHKELLDIFIPLLRADYKIIETYQIQPNQTVLFDCGITVFNGKADKEVSHDKLREWQRYTKSRCQVYEYEGGHFFIQDYREDIIQIINDTLIGTIINSEAGLKAFNILA
jgi:medium-chain acyl-[acyl-carrier-protein] hydrolase